MRLINLLILFTSMQFVFSASTKTLEGSKVKNNRIKMLNGKYAKLYDFNKEGPMIVNFWTTW